MCGCESWTIKKTEHWRIDAFELWCWTRLLRVPWTARRSNQSILKEISSEYSLKELQLKLKLQYFGQLMWRVNSLEKTLMVGKSEGKKRRGQQRVRCLDDIINSMHMNLSKLWGMVKDRKAWLAAIHGISKSQTHLREQQQSWSQLLIQSALAFHMMYSPYKLNKQGDNILLSQYWTSLLFHVWL